MEMEFDMIDYTIEDLKDKYVETGTLEAGVFFAACENVGIEPSSGHTFEFRFVEAIDLDDGDGVMLYGRYKEESLNPKSKPFTIKPQWTPQTNTLPLRDLSDEQAAQLFNAWRGGAILEKLGDCGWYESSNYELLQDTVCRIKPKSPKQELVDSIIEHYKGSTFLDSSVIDMLESAYDAGLFSQTEGLKK